MILSELAALLISEGVVPSVYLGSAANIPTSDGPYITLVETGGRDPEYVQNAYEPAYQRPAVQLVVRAKSYLVARTTAKSAYDVLSKVRNQMLGSVWYRSITPLQEPFDIGLDDRQRARVAFNVLAVKRPS